MTKEQREFLDIHKNKYHSLKSGGFVHISMNEAETFHQIALTFDNRYPKLSPGCGECTASLVDYVFQQAAKAEVNPEPVMEIRDWPKQSKTKTKV